MVTTNPSKSDVVDDMTALVELDCLASNEMAVRGSRICLAQGCAFHTFSHTLDIRSLHSPSVEIPNQDSSPRFKLTDSDPYNTIKECFRTLVLLKKALTPPIVSPTAV
jgi:hypothetical protein